MVLVTYILIIKKNLWRAPIFYVNVWVKFVTCVNIYRHIRTVLWFFERRADSAHEKYNARGQGRARGDAVALQARRCSIWSMHLPHRGSKYRRSVCVWHAHWKRANSNSRLRRRRATTRGAFTSGKVTAVFVCRDATQRSEKKEVGKRERERDEEREKQQSKPCRATAVARVAVHNKNRRCFNVTNIYFPQFLFILFPPATRLIMCSASETWNRESESLLSDWKH